MLRKLFQKWSNETQPQQELSKARAGFNGGHSGHVSRCAPDVKFGLDLPNFCCTLSYIHHFLVFSWHQIFKEGTFRRVYVYFQIFCKAHILSWPLRALWSLGAQAPTWLNPALGGVAYTSPQPQLSKTLKKMGVICLHSIQASSKCRPSWLKNF